MRLLKDRNSDGWLPSRYRFIQNLQIGTWPKSLQWAVGLLGVLILAGLCWIIGLGIITDSEDVRILNERGVVATGLVVDCELRRVGRHWSRVLVADFDVEVDGRVHTLRSERKRYNACRSWIGSRVDVLYDPVEPTRSRILIATLGKPPPGLLDPLRPENLFP